MPRTSFISLLLLLFAYTCCSAAEVTIVQDSKGVIKKWQPGRQLFVEGSVGLTSKKLQSIAKYLEDYPNWLVYLTEKSAGEVYRGSNNKKFRGYAAVQNRLGHELINNTGFGELKDEATTKANGNILYISFDKDGVNRKVGYIASRYNIFYGLEDNKFAGGFDRFALRALKNGRRIKDAITETIEHANKTVRSEKDRRQRQRFRQKQDATIAMASIQAKSESTRASLQQFKKDNPSLSPPFVHTDWTTIDSKILGVEKLIQLEEYNEIEQVIQSIDDQLDPLGILISSYKDWGERLENEKELLNKLKSSPKFSQIKRDFQRSTSQLNECEQQWQYAKLDSVSLEESILQLEDGISALQHSIKVKLPAQQKSLNTAISEIQLLQSHRYQTYIATNLNRLLTDAQALQGASHNESMSSFEAKIASIEAEVNRLENYLDRDLTPLLAQLAELKADFKTLDPTTLPKLYERIQSTLDSYNDHDQIVKLSRGSWYTTLERLSKQVKQIRSREQIEKTLEAQLKKRNTYMIWAVLCIFVLVCLLVFLRSLRLKRNAKKLYESWSKLITSKTTELYELEVFKDKVIGQHGREKSFTGKTEALAIAMRKTMGELFVLRSLARKQLNSVKAMIESKSFGRFTGLFAFSRYLNASKRLTREKIEFDRDSGLEAILNEQEDDKAFSFLLSDLDDLQAFRLSFSQLVTEFNERAEKALNGLENLDRSSTSVIDSIEQLAQVGVGLEANYKTLLSAKHPVDLEGVKTFLGSKFAQNMQKIQQQSIKDPIGAIENCKLTLLCCTHAQDLCAKFVEANQKDAPKIKELELALSARVEYAPHEFPLKAIQVAWIFDEIQELTQRANDYLNRLNFQEPEAAVVNPIQVFQNLFRRCQACLEIDTTRRTQFRKQVEECRQLIDQSRRQLAAKLGVPSSQILHEPESNPEAFYKKGLETIAKCAARLSEGRVELAQLRVEQAMHFIGSASNIVKRTIESFESFDHQIKSLSELEHKIHAQLPARKDSLQKIRMQFAAEALLIGTGSNLNTQETIDNNISEISEAMDQAQSQRSKAQDCYKTGALLESAFNLQGGFDSFNYCLARLREIQDREEYLHELVASNKDKLNAVQNRMKSIGEKISDFRTMDKSQSMFNETGLELRQLEGSIAMPKPNPITNMEKLEDFILQSERMEEQIERDWQCHAAACLSADAARSAQVDAVAASEKGLRDGVPDSESMVNAREYLLKLEDHLEHLEATLLQPHQNWLELDRMGRSLCRDFEQEERGLERELEEGRKSTRSIDYAQESVIRARHWAGGLGVRVYGQPGESLLDLAISALQGGDYAQAIFHSQEAMNEANAAIAAAEKRLREKREKRRKAAAARRRAEARRRAAASSLLSRSSSFGRSSFSDSISSSSFGGGSFGGGSSGGSSSFGGSSTGSSSSFGGSSVGSSSSW